MRNRPIKDSSPERDRARIGKIPLAGKEGKGQVAIARPRIGIDLHVADGFFQGSRTHCLELFSRVIAITPECDFVVLSGRPHELANFSPHFTRSNVTLVEMRHKPAPVRLLWQLPRIIDRYKLSMLHAQYIVPPLSQCATAVTIHDILFESHPEYFNRLFVLRSRLLVRNSARRSVVSFTVSDFSYQEISRIYGVPTGRLHKIPNGVDTSRFVPGMSGVELVKGVGLVPGAYYLTVGRLEPRKNHIALLRAWVNFSLPRPKLVIVGQRHFGYANFIRLISELGVESDVLLLENVSDQVLPALYRNAKCFLYCSWAEGFGMPLLEAMASGIPVITSPNTALGEVGAGAALYANPADPLDIFEKVQRLEQQPDLREKLISAGLARTREYTWEAAAQTVRTVYLEYFGRLSDL